MEDAIGVEEDVNQNKWARWNENDFGGESLEGPADGQTNKEEQLFVNCSMLT